MRSVVFPLVLVAVLGMAGWWGYWNVPDARHEVIGGTPRQRAELAAAYEMFRLAGLDLPPMAVRFFEDPHRCGRYGRGRAHEKWPRHVVSICNDSRMTMIHELAHVWTYGTLDEGERDVWVDFTGARAWRGSRIDWVESGSEQAAEVVMWRVLAGGWVPRTGPMDEPSLTAAWEWMSSASEGPRVARLGSS